MSFDISKIQSVHVIVIRSDRRTKLGAIGNPKEALNLNLCRFIDFFSISTVCYTGALSSFGRGQNKTFWCIFCQTNKKLGQVNNEVLLFFTFPLVNRNSRDLIKTVLN